MKKVACFYADGTEELELIAVVDVLRRGGVQADLISISGEMPVSAHNIRIQADLLIEDAVMEQYDAIYIPGGSQGAEHLSKHPKVLDAIVNFHANSKLIASICAGPTVLEAAGVLKGHSGTSYPGYEKELSFELYKEELVVVSNQVVTSRGPATAMLLGFEMLRQLDLADQADQLWDGMLMNQLKNSLV